MGETNFELLPVGSMNSNDWPHYLDAQTKTCNECGVTQPLSSYHVAPECRGGRNTKCKECVSKYNAKQWVEKHGALKAAKFQVDYYADPRPFKDRSLKRIFGISLADYEGMHEAQRGVCAICFEPETAKHKSGTINRLSVDHDHYTGRIRKLLCANCNRGLGMFDDSVTSLTNAAKYLGDYRD